VGVGLSSSGVYELGVETGFSFEKALRVQALAQPIELVVEVVADLVQEGAEECLEGYNLPTLGGAHPN
jgi:hypothetical protein